MNEINKKIIFAVVTLFLLSIFVCGVSADDSLDRECAGIIMGASNEMISISGDVKTIESDLLKVINLNNNIDVNSSTVTSDISDILQMIDIITNNSLSTYGELETVKNEIADIAFDKNNPMTDLIPLSAGVNSVAGKLNNIPPELAAVSAKLIDIAQKSENLSEYPTPTPTETKTPKPTQTMIDEDGNVIYYPEESIDSYTSSYVDEPEIDYSAYYTSANLSSDLAKVSVELESITNSLNTISSDLLISSSELAAFANGLDSSIQIDITPTETITPIITQIPSDTVTPVIAETIEPTLTPEENQTVSSTEDNTFGTILIIIIIGAAAVVIIVAVVIIIKKKKPNADEKFDALSSRFTPKQTAQAETDEIEPAVFKQPEENESDEPSVEEATPIKAPVIIEKEEKKTEYSLNDSNIPLIEIYNLVAGSISKRYGIKNISSLTPRQMISLVNEPTSELKEFSALYEKMKYSQDSEPQDRNRLKSLAETILKQYRS